VLCIRQCFSVVQEHSCLQGIQHASKLHNRACTGDTGSFQLVLLLNVFATGLEFQDSRVSRFR
jgi:hypothetical protein